MPPETKCSQGGQSAADVRRRGPVVRYYGDEFLPSSPNRKYDQATTVLSDIRSPEQIEEVGIGLSISYGIDISAVTVNQSAVERADEDVPLKHAYNELLNLTSFGLFGGHYGYERILRAIDHTNQTGRRLSDIRLLRRGHDLQYGVVCIPPSLCQAAADTCRNLVICTVIGFPNGYSAAVAKCFEAEDAVKNGAEIDMV